MKKILGLDLGTNSIGWAVVNLDFDNKKGQIIDLGSRIIPMSQDILGKFETGQSVSQTAERTKYRGIRRLYQRSNLRRERLHRVLNILGFLPEHYSNDIDFEVRLGQFKENKEPKIAYRPLGNGKYEFIFQDAYAEMLEDFKKAGINKKVPYDWTIYYLRKKALREKIKKEELAWIILNFNTKRGYYQLRGDELESKEDKDKKYYLLTVKDVKPTDDKNSKGTWYEISFEDFEGVYRRQSKDPLDNWIGKQKEFIITKSKNKDGSTKYSFRAPKEDDWRLIKKKTEQDIENSGKVLCEYIYDNLLKNPNQKIRGKLIRTIERKFYKEELIKILKKQIELEPELFTKEKYLACINELYPNNDIHREKISKKDFVYLFIDDIIFYQRPLKSQKSNISTCQYEYRVYKKYNPKTGKKDEIEVPLKAIPKSHPLYQEFRLWQFIKNLKIYQKEAYDENGKLIIDKDVTKILFKDENDWAKLFDFLNNRKEIKQEHIINFLTSKKYIEKGKKNNYRWNYVEKPYPAAETRVQIISRLKNVQGKPELTDEQITNLWHIIYSVTDKEEFRQALGTFAEKNNIDKDSFVKAFEKFPKFKSDYGAYSQKAIKKLLTLMRRGKYWDENLIPEEIKQRINDIMGRLKAINFDKERIEEVADDDIQKQVLKSFLEFKDKNPLTGLNTYQAGYAVYGRHSEARDISKWNSPDDIDEYLKNFKQHSLRNPIVEQVVTETLRTVRDLWKEYGNFDEIHLELGRDMKNPAEKRKEISKRNIENENTNHRIRLILSELASDGVQKVNEYSPSHQEILKIYEEGVYQNPDAKYDKIKQEEIEKIRKNPNPSKNDIIRYKLWLEQGYVSPYTGETIPLSRLFTKEYEIEHIIPRSLYFDNSLSNKVICESAVNKLKDKQTAYEFIKNHGGQSVDLGEGKTVKVFKLDEYEAHCNRYFGKNRAKLKKLLSEEIPDEFIKRQINDTRYISKFVKSLLSNIVREDGEQTETSKNLIAVTGAITSELKKHWGLIDKWNEIILPRFERMNELTNSNDFTFINENGKKVPQVPLELRKGFSKKRIDHRHHALDALVIACTTRKHIQYLNSLNNENIKHDLIPSLLIKDKNGNYTKYFQLPWQSFPADAKEKLETTIISFKQNLRVINKTKNRYWKWVEKDGKKKKQLVQQVKGDNWAIRKPLHKETVAGRVLIKKENGIKLTDRTIEAVLKGKYILENKKLDKKIKQLAEEGLDSKQIHKYFKNLKYKFNDIDVSNLQVFIKATAVRTPLTSKFSVKNLESITDSGIKKILKNHLKNYKDENGKENFELAFSPEGIEELNKNIKELNGGKPHKPIYSVRLYEEGNKFAVGHKGNKSKKYVEAAKGTNLFFAIYWNEEKQKREFETIPLNEVIEHQKQTAHLPKYERTPIPINNEKGRFLFTLSPNDLVYVPTDEELENPNSVDFDNLTKEQVNRIYKMVSSTTYQCFFIKSTVSSVIKNKFEFSSKNKMEKSIEGIMIKERCWKLKVNRLGKIVEILR